MNLRVMCQEGLAQAGSSHVTSRREKIWETPPI